MKDKIRQRVHEWIEEAGIDCVAGASYEEINAVINKTIIETARAIEDYLNNED